MIDWRDLISAKDWDSLDHFWMSQTADVCGEVLVALRRIVPTVERVNGIEREREFARPDEVAPEDAGAARILFLGELEAAANKESGPPPYFQQWERMSEDVRRVCSKLAALPEVTKGAPHMSRGHHAGEVVQLTSVIAAVIRAMVVSDHGDEEVPDGLAASLQEHVATAAVCAFAAGRHFQLALGKGAEPDALRGIKVHNGARNSGRLGGRKAEEKSAIILAEMNRLLHERPYLKPTGVAALVHRRGLGTSADANRKLWERRSRNRT